MMNAELLLKYLILFRDMHEINPLYCIENEIAKEAIFTEKDTKEKRLFILNILNITFISFLSDECTEKMNISNEKKRAKFTEMMELFFKAISHPCVYTLIADSIPKLATWAKKTPEDRKWFCGLIEKWVVDNVFEVNSTIDEKAQQVGESILSKILPHMSARIFHALSKDHADLIDKDLVVKVLWVYRKLLLFLENYFKKTAPVPGMPEITDIEYKEKYKGIFFPTDIELKYDINALHYSQVTIVYSMKVAAVKTHEFDINILDGYLKLLDNTITYCKNEDLSMIIYEIYECLLKAPNPNSLGVTIDLSLAKKVWLGGCLLKKAVGESSKALKDKMETIITDLLTSHKLNSLDELMNLYEYAAFFFTNPENKKKIQRAFEASFGGGVFTRLRLIFENKEDQEFTKMNFPPIIMRKISEAIMAHFDDSLIVCQSNRCMMLRDLCNTEGVEEQKDDELMDVDGDQAIDKILRDHRNFLDNPKMRDETQIFDLLKSITNIHESKYYYHNVKRLFPQVWKSFSKEQKNYLAQCMISFFKNYIKFMQNQKKKAVPELESFPNELLEIFQALEPQIVIPIEIYSKVATKYNCWVNCILILEQQVKIVPDYDKYSLILNDLYKNLEQDDYYLNKCNTKVLNKAQTYSQFRMWEEVNQEFNDALMDMYTKEEIPVDLKYANEHDQKVWEDLHADSIVQIGDLDRQKFFHVNGRNYGAFKAEFQKWMVLGKSQPTYQVFESNREKLCQEWTALPKFIDQVHYHRLTKFQENVELNEIMALLHNCRGQSKDRIMRDFYTASAIQRDRVPISCESNRVWKDILENRYLPLTMLNTTLEAKRKSAADQANPGNAGIKGNYAFKRLLNYVWDKALIAQQSRKQNLLEVSKKFLIEVEQQTVKSDTENLKGLALHKEKYILTQERMKLILHYFRNHVKLKLEPEDFLQIREQLISKALELSAKSKLDHLRQLEAESVNEGDQNDQNKDKVYNEIWESEIYRLRGEVFMEAKKYDDANE